MSVNPHGAPNHCCLWSWCLNGSRYLCESRVKQCPRSCFQPSQLINFTGNQDFRSQDGLYSKRFTHNGVTLSGQELFDVSTTQNASKLAILNKLMTQLRIQARTASPTLFHQLVASFHETDRLKRCYTQNFDGLQTRDNPEMVDKVVELHGSNEQLFCYACSRQPSLPVIDFDLELLKTGLVRCPSCQEIGKCCFLIPCTHLLIIRLKTSRRSCQAA